MKSSRNKLKNPFITIVSVVYNGESNLERTILSVINQEFKDFEYIIIDGGSSDNTLSIINKYDHLIDFWISEKDNGIYDAMNKGVSFSNGEYIQFLNSGDLFVSNFTLDLASKFMVKPYKIFIFDYIMGEKVYTFNSNFISLLKGTPCHQALFYELSFLKNNPFSLNYKICADYFNFLEAYFVFETKNINQNLVVYDLNGISSSFSSKRIIRLERLKIVFASKIPFLWKFPMVLYNLIRLIK